MTSVTGKKIFGAGRFFGINSVTNPTPMRSLLPQDISIDFKQGTKELRGEKKLPAAIAAGDMSVTGKITLGDNPARMYADFLFSTAGTTGQILEADKEAWAIPGTPYQVTVANSTTFTTDLGVLDPVTGKTYTRVASAPATGQYSVAAGVYTFAAADTTKNVVISYLYTNAVTGEQFVVANSLQGPAGAFQAVMTFFYGTDQDVFVLNNCIATDAAIASKQGDFAKPTFGFMAATDSSDNLGTLSFAQAT